VLSNTEKVMELIDEGTKKPLIKSFYRFADTSSVTDFRRCLQSEKR
jgi:hypothetical protein